MIYDNLLDIEKDLFNTIKGYLIDIDINLSKIESMLITFLYELKIIKEIDDFKCDIQKNIKTIIVSVVRGIENNIFNIDINLQLRKIKIDQVKDFVKINQIKKNLLFL